MGDDTAANLIGDFLGMMARPLKELVSKVDSVAYKRGCDDTLAKIVAAAQPPGNSSARTEIEPVRETPSAVPIDWSKSAQMPKRRAAKGSVPKFLNQVLIEEGYPGLDYADIGERIVEIGGEGIALASVRNRLRVMELAGKAVRHQGKWQLTEEGKAEVRREILASHPIFK
jgi:hypothetical protein